LIAQPLLQIKTVKEKNAALIEQVIKFDLARNYMVKNEWMT
jgi:hypothetical protein